MSRVHDMGGRFGDGAVVPEEPGAPVFDEEWHARALAVTLACGALGQWNLDMSRHARECLSPQDYMAFSYFEKWISGLADLLVREGVLTRGDLAGDGSNEPHPLADRAMKAGAVASILAAGGPADRPGGSAPSFRPGDPVRTRRPSGNRMIDGGHTRLPGYASGARGVIVRVHGNHVLPDSNAHRLGEAPEPLYSVAFPARELWTNPENPADEVMLDLWQSYLVPADDG